MELNKTIYTHNHIESLKKSAAVGCFFCSQAFYSLTEYQRSFLKANHTKIRCTAGYDNRADQNQTVQVRFDFPRDIQHFEPYRLE